MFSFNLREDLKIRLKSRSERLGTNITFIINRAIEFQLDRDDELEKNIKRNEDLYGESNTPKDADEIIKEMKKKF